MLTSAQEQKLLARLSSALDGEINRPGLLPRRFGGAIGPWLHARHAGMGMIGPTVPAVPGALTGPTAPTAPTAPTRPTAPAMMRVPVY